MQISFCVFISLSAYLENKPKVLKPIYIENMRKVIKRQGRLQYNLALSPNTSRDIIWANSVNFRPSNPPKRNTFIHVGRIEWAKKCLTLLSFFSQFIRQTVRWNSCRDTFPKIYTFTLFGSETKSSSWEDHIRVTY